MKIIHIPSILRLHSIPVQTIENCLRSHERKWQFEQFDGVVSAHVEFVGRVNGQTIPPFRTFLNVFIRMVDGEHDPVSTDLIHGVLQISSGVVSRGGDPNVLGKIVSDGVLRLPAGVLKSSAHIHCARYALNLRTPQCYTHYQSVHQL